MVTFRITPRRHDTVDTSDDSVAGVSDPRTARPERYGRTPLSQTGDLSDFAPGYAVPDGTEPYITVSPGVAVDGADDVGPAQSVAGDRRGTAARLGAAALAGSAAAGDAPQPLTAAAESGAEAICGAISAR